MLSDLSYSTAVISKRVAFKHQVSSVFLTTVLLSAVVFSGCTESTYYASPETVRALTILGSTDPANSNKIVGGIRALDGVESFVTALDVRMATQMETRLDEFLGRLGLDPETESLSIYFSIDGLSGDATPSAVVFAPLTEDRLDALLDDAPFVEQVSLKRSGNSFSFRDNRSEQSVFFSLIEDKILLIAASQSALDMMHSRAHAEPAESPSEQKNDYSELVAMASQGQFWVVSESVQQLLAHLPVENSNTEIELLTKATAAAAMSFDIHEDGKDGPAVTLSLFLVPRKGIDVDDLVDIAEGLIGLGRLKGESLPEIDAVIDFLDVSEQNGSARISIDVSATDIEDLLRQVRNVKVAR